MTLLTHDALVVIGLVWYLIKFLNRETALVRSYRSVLLYLGGGLILLLASWYLIIHREEVVVSFALHDMLLTMIFIVLGLLLRCKTLPEKTLLITLGGIASSYFTIRYLIGISMGYLIEIVPSFSTVKSIVLFSRDNAAMRPILQSEYDGLYLIRIVLVCVGLGLIVKILIQQWIFYLKYQKPSRATTTPVLETSPSAAQHSAHDNQWLMILSSAGVGILMNYAVVWLGGSVPQFATAGVAAALIAYARPAAIATGDKQGGTDFTIATYPLTVLFSLLSLTSVQLWSLPEMPTEGQWIVISQKVLMGSYVALVVLWTIGKYLREIPFQKALALQLSISVAEQESAFVAVPARKNRNSQPHVLALVVGALLMDLSNAILVQYQFTH